MKKPTSYKLSADKSFKPIALGHNKRYGTQAEQRKNEGEKGGKNVEKTSTKTVTPQKTHR